MYTFPQDGSNFSWNKHNDITEKNKNKMVNKKMSGERADL